MQPQPPYGTPGPEHLHAPSQPYPPGAAGTPYPPHPPAQQVSNRAAALVAARTAGLVVVALGLSVPFDDTSMWSTTLAWSILAALASLVALIAGLSGTSPTARLVGLGATAALLAHWVLVALPGVGSNAGFCLTLGTGTIVAAAWFQWGKTLTR